ncbi:hypothetical protein Phum_PHUM262910 [Pediculus humanus corporis]|uniref:Uncharacterized protein n=1 Tax=Pediculus humanus subsp. corporis TaxID=121224 RepID=E0VKG0_PEDHC|nr:uncharacterized protein Phum_PHUM262910 [Pediculus humanus corporis]EEB13876.1 hypothetical protein Phum_PHUM262910 [Pediculus humanus corporis]
MPSVKAFPKATKIPEPLNKILEPTVIRHLDADSDSPREYSNVQNRHQVEVDIEQVCEVKNKYVRGKTTMTRHASLEGDDPGFIGPVVWNRHFTNLNEEEIEYENVNVGKMRRRFNELLDDALSMFGSKNGSPEGSDVEPVRQLDNRIHSAVIRPAGVTKIEGSTSCRPNTTGSKRPQSSLVTQGRLKGAWETPSCSTLSRPLSAGIFQETSPRIDKRFIYANSELSPNDPAIPLIAAIKNELKKFDGTTPSNNETN